MNMKHRNCAVCTVGVINIGINPMPFHLKNISIKKNSKSFIGLRFDDLISEKSLLGLKNIFQKIVNVHHFLGNFILEISWKIN